MNINIETLLQPVSEQHPCGEDLSFSNAFHDIKKAKTQDDPLLDQGDWVAEPKQADWVFVAEKCTELLQQQSKDIRLLTWLSEAWAHLYGFAGLAKSLELSYRMLQDYWREIHPELDDDEDLDQRLGLLQGLVNQLPVLIKTVALVNSSPFYALFDYESFLHQQNNRRKHSEDYDSTDMLPELEQFEQALSASSKTFQQQNYQDFQSILVHWHTLKNVLDQLMQLDAPSFAQVDSQLDDIQSALDKIYKTHTFSHIATTNSAINPPVSQDNNTPISSENLVRSTEPLSTTTPTMVNQVQQSFQPAPQSHIQNREQALKILQDISKYFQENEPHSPVSYMLNKTIAWSQMPLHEWLAQVVKNDNPLESIQELLGVQSNNNESNDW
ncbi:type VI secretion system protein TssA [Acinetobacter larvae]|uniref:Type VI secretion protein n=1 Tax=Acinetobacter larvae TaxID=1789224 RepID=A0A1B2M0Y9_9GAMM|nr:type VI secretion system protein TssA [Acinetobacter larvae]AOA58845.1 type VI secretion protein [Acinetobacter larvae]